MPAVNDEKNHSLKTLLERRVAYFLSPLESFIHKQTTAGILLILFSVFALVITNTPWGCLLERLSSLEFGILLADNHFSLSLDEWVSQGLMALFFFLTGLEIKREILAGKLTHFKEVRLVCLAALGGIAVPAFLYYLMNRSGTGMHGWGIPTATDTAFAIGILALMASRVSLGMTVFLTALAIFDDIGAIAIISIFYAHDMNIPALLAASIVFLTLLSGNRLGIRNGWFYAALGLLLWITILQAGIHATFAGILLAMTIPARSAMSQLGFISNIKRLTLNFEKRYSDSSMLGSQRQHSIASDIGDTVRAASTPLQRWESGLITPIAIIVLPLFALLNAGFYITDGLIERGMSSSVTLGIIVGLVVGKPLGIFTFTYIGVRTGWGRLPEGITWNEVAGAALLAGIGFTMSIFFTTLSFPQDPELLELAKLGILVSSFMAALMGSLWIYCTSRLKA